MRLASTTPTTLASGTPQPRMKVSSPAPRRMASNPARTRSAGVSVASCQPPVDARSEREVQLEVGEAGSRRASRASCSRWSSTSGCVVSRLYMKPSSPPPQAGFHQLRRGSSAVARRRSGAIQSGCRRASSESGAARKGASQMPGRRPRAAMSAASLSRRDGNFALVSSQSPMAAWYPSSSWKTSKGHAVGGGEVAAEVGLGDRRRSSGTSCTSRPGRGRPPVRPPPGPCRPPSGPAAPTPHRPVLADPRDAVQRAPLSRARAPHRLGRPRSAARHAPRPPAAQAEGAVVLVTAVEPENDLPAKANQSAAREVNYRYGGQDLGETRGTRGGR